MSATDSASRPAPRFDEIAKRTRRWRLDALPADVLLRLERNHEARMRELLGKAQRLEVDMSEAAERADMDALDKLQQRFRSLQREHGTLEEQGERIRHAYQERRMRDTLASTLGGRRRVAALEALVLLLIVLVLGLLLYEYFTPGLDVETLRTFFLIDAACCAVFLAEFALRYRSAESKRWYWRRYWIDFVTSIPVPPGALLVRSGRLLRLVRIVRFARLMRFLRFLRAIRILLYFWRGMDKLRDVLDVRLMRKSLVLGLGVLVLGGLLIQRLERGVERVGTVGEAVWWSFTTVVTGGYGDIHNPISSAGRFVTVVLVIAGMIIVGVFTATLTALLVDDEAAEIELAQHEIADAIKRLSDRVDDLAQRGSG